MNKRIIYQAAGLPVSVMIPADCGLTIEQIGRKDVPAGVPFWIVDSSTIPADRSLRDAWELDVVALGEPAGYGAAA